jgi:hypothetical protein
VTELVIEILRLYKQMGSKAGCAAIALRAGCTRGYVHQVLAKYDKARMPPGRPWWKEDKKKGKRP